MSSENITEYEINDEIRKILNSIAEKYEFKKFSLEVTEGSLKGDGYVGIVKNVTIINENDLNQTLNLFLKISPRGKNIREMLPLAEIFHTEVYMYDAVFPLFKNLEIQNAITETIVTPKFFGSLLNNENEVLIMENLRKDGYRLHDKKTLLNNEHINLVMGAYAKFHSLSLALRNQQPKFFENVQSQLCNSFPKLMNDIKDVLINKYTDLLNVLNEEDSKKIRNYLQNIDFEFKEILNTPVDEYSVILHGDCWINNMMFKYLDGSSSPTDVCLIDYQVARLASPVLDLTYFFFSSSSKNEVKRCNEYLNLYYKNLSTHLRKLGCDPNKLYPYSVFMKQWKALAKFSLIMAPLPLLVTTLGIENDTIDFQKSAKAGNVTIGDAFNRDTKNNKDFNSRLKTIVSYLAENDLI